MKTLPKQFIVAFSLFAISTLGWSTDTLLRGQNITEGQYLISPQGTFELGFFNTGSANHFLGIWFRVSPDSPVWVANRDNPLKNNSGMLTINNGFLVLYDSSVRMVWSSSTSTNSTINSNEFSPILQLHDSGNLILKDQTTNATIWQSFDYPTNTLLPGMKLGKNLTSGFETAVSSWKSSTDPSKGEYKYNMDTEGDPEVVLWDHDQIRYRTGLWNGRYFSATTQMLTYGDMLNFFFVWDKDEVSYRFEPKSTSILSQLLLTDTGIIQRLIWDPDQQKWNEFWSGPKDECDYYGKCGDFGICQPNSLTSCNCLTGFEPATLTDWNMRYYSGGCKRRTPLGCTDKSDGFYALKGVKLPDSHNSTVDQNISVDECRTRCLRNCACLAYSPSDIRGKGSGCVMWTTALADIKYVNGGLDVLHVKVSKSELGTSNKKKLVIIIGTISSIVASMLVICLISYLLRRKKMRTTKQDISQAPNNSIKDADLPVFDIATILQATYNFSTTNIIGQGGFGSVYKGKLPNDQEIAVKRLSGNSSEGLHEFLNEVTLIAKLQHRNLVKLIGCCIDNNERILIYEFMSNKSLDFFIFNAEKRAALSWTTRLEIVIGIARGLLYLHHDSRFNIIHRDLKAANILLDEHMNPKISDFGTARLFEREQAVIRTETVVGTRGYMSPEYITEGKFSAKSDVYSFGVLLLEIISGKRNQGNQNLIAYAWKLWETDNIWKLLDEAVESAVITTELSRCIHVGLLCVQELPDDRPSMSSVFMMLSSKNQELPAPKKPITYRSFGEFTADGHFSEYDSVTVDKLTITGIIGR